MGRLPLPWSCWSAVRHDDVPGFVQLFGSYKVERCRWSDFDGAPQNLRTDRYAVVYPPADGTIFFVLRAPELFPIGHFKDVQNNHQVHMRLLSSEFSEAYTFWNTKLSSGLIKWTDGVCVRAVSFGEERHAEWGPELDEEVDQIGLHLADHDRSSGLDIYATADGVGINIMRTPPKASTEDPCVWVVDLG